MEPENTYERVVFAIARRLSEGQVIWVSCLAYAGIGLALPLIFGWTTAWFVAANITGTAFAVSILLAWFVPRIAARDRRHLVEWTTDLRLLDSQEFEWLIGELYRRDGWTVRETGRQDGPDGGVDLELTRGDHRRLVQCKRWASWQVGVEEVRKLGGTLLRDGMKGQDGVLVTLSGFTPQAGAEAARMGIELLDGRALYNRMEEHRRGEPCPVCGADMLLDRSPHGWWFRCRAVGCHGKRDLGRDPVRAVELLNRANVD